MGGDEINLIAGKKHYGWPYYAYGYDYDYDAKFNFPHSADYEKPSFYFLSLFNKIPYSCI